jgi:hypothetical protein
LEAAAADHARASTLEGAAAQDASDAGAPLATIVAMQTAAIMDAIEAQVDLVQASSAPKGGSGVHGATHLTFPG